MKGKICMLLAAVLWCQILFGTVVWAASENEETRGAEQRNDILRAANYEGFGAWWKNRVSGLVDIGTMMFYETGQGQTAYCLSNKKGHPDQMEYVLSDETGMEESFGKEEKEAVLRILRAGYPLSQGYWREKGLTDLDMRGATQIALWYVQAQFGVDDHTGGSWKNGSWGNLGQRDVKSMIDALVQYGLYGGENPVFRSLSLDPGETVIQDGRMISSFEGRTTGYERWELCFTGLPEQTVVQINGRDVMDCRGEISGTEQGRLSIVLQYPCQYGKTISCTMTGYQFHEKENLLYYRPREQAAQDMAVFRMDIYESGQAVSASLTSIRQRAGRIRLLKRDADTGACVSEGNASYGIYRDQQTVELVSLLAVEQGIGFSEPLPFGTYYLRELSSPFGYALSEEVTEVMIREDSSFQEHSVTEISVSEKKQLGRIQIQKTDAETGEWISSPAVFSIVDQQTGQLVQRLTTGGDGTALSDPLLLGRVYVVTEEEAPAGYILPENASREVILSGTEDGREEILYPCLVENEMQTGSLSVSKTGDGIVGFLEQKTGVQILYEDIPLEGVCYTVWAAEDISAPDKAATILAWAGDEIGSFTTDAEGRGGLSGLWPGQYVLRETGGRDGFVREQEERRFEIRAGGPGEASACREEIAIKNKRQMTEIALEKRDAKSQKGLSGAVYGLYTAEEIKGEKGAALGKDTLLQTVVTGEDGKAVFPQPVPGGFSYYVKELKAPEGFLLSEEKEYLRLPSGQERISPVKAVVYDMPREEETFDRQEPDGGEPVLVHTGDLSTPFLFALTACGAASAAFVLGSLRKKY